MRSATNDIIHALLALADEDGMQTDDGIVVCLLREAAQRLMELRAAHDLLMEVAASGVEYKGLKYWSVQFPVTLMDDIEKHFEGMNNGRSND